MAGSCAALPLQGAAQTRRLSKVTLLGFAKSLQDDAWYFSGIFPATFSSIGFG
jgi:hypothetical protein